EGFGGVAEIGSYVEWAPATFYTRELRVFLKKDGTVWRTGREQQAFEQLAPLRNITDIHGTFALSGDGTLWQWPSELPHAEAKVEASPVEGLSAVNKLWSNGRTTLAIDDQAKLWFMGATVTGYSDGTTTHMNTLLRLESIDDVQAAYAVERSLLVWTANGD